MKLQSIEIVEDRTSKSRCDEGFLRVSRLIVRNLYDDGSASASYPCDVVSRPGSDAVVAILYEIDDERRIRVLLRENPRVPLYLRREKDFVHPDPRPYDSIVEVVAGLVEPEDGSGIAGMQRRAAIEAEEEVGLRLDAGSFRVVGDEAFASPGTTDEKVYYCAGPAKLSNAKLGPGDGGAMEEHAELVVHRLRDAIRLCREGAIPDMKTEVALLRLADHLGYIPQLDRFVDELPAELRSAYDNLGVAKA